MGRYLTITHSNVHRLGYKKRTVPLSLSIGPIAFRFLLLLSLCALGLFFVNQTNESSLKGYKIRELEDRRKALLLENEKLNAEVLRLKALENINTDELNLTTPKKIDYLPAQGPVAIGR
jgi:hypothetical protein